jgi:hypothetical protein
MKRMKRRLGGPSSLIGLLFLITCVSCGGGGNGGGGTVQNAQIAGPWEVVATSTALPGTDPIFVEANLTQTSTSVQSSRFLAINACVSADSSSSVSGTVNGNDVLLTASFAGVMTTLSGTVSSADSTASGTYKTSGACGTDAGTWKATKMAVPSGTYSGNLFSFSNPTQGNAVTAIIDTNSSFEITGTASVSSVCFNSLTLSGTQAGGEVTMGGKDALGDTVVLWGLATNPTFSEVDLDYIVVEGSCSGDTAKGTLAKSGSSAAAQVPSKEGLDRALKSLGRTLTSQQ